MSNVEQDLRPTGSLLIAEASARIYYSGALKNRFNANLPYLSGTLVLTVQDQSLDYGVGHKYSFHLTRPNRRGPVWVYHIAAGKFYRYLFESPHFHSFCGEVR